MLGYTTTIALWVTLLVGLTFRPAILREPDVALHQLVLNLAAGWAGWLLGWLTSRGRRRRRDD